MKLLFFTVILLLALYICALERPFPPGVVQELKRLSNLPSLINSTQMLAGLTPAELEAFLASISTETTNKSQPNPLANTFPNMTTGTINASYFILPLEYSVARAIIPSKYGILKESINAVLPFFPEHKYPVRRTNPVETQTMPTLTRTGSLCFLPRSITTCRLRVLASLISV